MKHCLVILFLTALTGCNKEVVEKCYTCDQFITYTTTSPTFIPLSPYTTSKQACTDDEKVKLEKTPDVVTSLGGAYTLTKRTQTVCVKRAL